MENKTTMTSGLSTLEGNRKAFGFEDVGLEELELTREINIQQTVEFGEHVYGDICKRRKMRREKMSKKG